MYLIFDTETTGLPKDFTKPISDFDNWSFARCVQIGWQLHDKYGKLIDVGNDIIKPDDFDIPQISVKIHGITNEKANKCGISIKDSLEKFTSALKQAVFLIGHNVKFDINVIGSEYYRIQNDSPLTDFKIIDTMKTTVDYCELRVGKEGVIKEVVSDGKWKTKEGDFMYKFKISFSQFS